MTSGGASASSGFALPRAARITRSDEIRALLRRGKRRKTRHLDVFVSTSPVAHSRVGFIVPKPRAKSKRGARRVRAAAVQRNRLKRRLKEIARVELLPRLRERGCALDVLVRARPEGYEASFGELREELIEVGGWLCSSER